MAFKGYIDRAAHRDRLRQELIAQHGEDYEPLGGWDVFFGPDNPVLDQKCQQCGNMVSEIRPFGKQGESICEACAVANANG